MRNTHGNTLIVARKLKIMENETQTLQDLEYGETTEKHGKRNTNTVRPGYGEKIEKCGK